MDDFKIVDNFLPQDVFNELQNKILKEPFPFYYTGKLNDNQTKEDQHYYCSTTTSNVNCRFNINMNYF